MFNKKLKEDLKDLNGRHKLVWQDLEQLKDGNNEIITMVAGFKQELEALKKYLKVESRQVTHHVEIFKKGEHNG